MAKLHIWVSFGSFVRQFRSSEVPEGRDVCQMAKLHIWVSFGSFVRQFRPSEVPEGRDACQMAKLHIWVSFGSFVRQFRPSEFLRVAMCAKWPNCICQTTIWRSRHDVS